MRNDFTKRTLAALLAATLGLGLTGTARAADLEVEVQGLASTEGHLLVAVFADAQNWLRKPVAVQRAVAATAVAGKLTIQLSGLPEGPLALSIIHDLNGNGRLDMNPVGMPMEPFGFSNNAAGGFGAPRFEDAVLSSASGSRVAVKLY
jgi:uncharacterized protein (DUF2141 family)